MTKDHHSDEGREPRPETKKKEREPQYVQPLHRPRSLEDTQPTPIPSPDEIETGELLGALGKPTVAMPRVPTGATPTADLPRTVPPPQRPSYVPPKTSSPPSGAGAQPADDKTRDWGRMLVRAGFIAAFSIVLIFFLGVGASIVGYFAIAGQLPAPEELKAHQATFVSSKILDRDGRLLYEVMDPQGGRRTRVSISEISPYVVQATIATEDRNFYAHPGFDPIAIARAIYYNLTEGEIVSGASTIPQQVARNLLLEPEERLQQTAWRKIKEIVLAAELMRTYERNEILEIYLNENNYGNLAYGIQAAAETYFNTDAANLSLAQASFLAGLPQSPATYDPFAGGLDMALARQEDVLALMVEDGYISHTDAALAAVEMRGYEFQTPQLDLAVAPHFVVYVRQRVETLYGPEALYRNEEGKSLRIYTTLDRRLQRSAEKIVREGVAALADFNATNGALVAIDPATGHIVAMVGSADFRNEEIDGQVNVALRCRQPGSAIKPFTYVAAFETGWTPATVLWDVRTEFPDGANPPYVPVNYDREYHGPMSVRKALANSYNVPAVETLQFVGVDGLLDISERLGVKSLVHPERHCPDYPYDQSPHYGLALTLGGGEAKLLEMTAAFAVFANGGTRIAPNPILRIEDSEGNVLVDNSNPTGEPVISPQHAYLITSILSDAQTRCIEFTCPSVLELSRPAAAKTGTTDDFRDALTIGYTPDLVTGVWVGNSDNSPMVNVPGAKGAGPIWHDFMEEAHADLPVRDFVRPSGIKEHEICVDSGARPSEYCPRRKRELFAKDQPPPGKEEDWYQKVRVDNATGLLANESCPNQVSEQVMVVIKDQRGREWAQAHPEYFNSLPLAPIQYCTESPDHPQVFITYPQPGRSVYGVVPVMGTVQLPNFEQYEVRYGIGSNPDRRDGWISGPHLAQVRDGLLTEWNVTGLPPGPYTLLVRAFDRERGPIEAQVMIYVAAPTATATPLRSPTPTSTPTPFPTLTPAPSTTPTPFPTPTPTAVPTPVSTVETTATVSIATIVSTGEPRLLPLTPTP